jgi:RNA polymerase sigma factor (sigma-70 family)
MPSGHLRAVLQHIQRRLNENPDAEQSDGALLEQFAGQGDEAAFDTLLRRHGPMVLAVCRRVLGNATDADDAFQATFLVLARKAASVRRCESVGSWLHGVAYRSALKAKTSAARRRHHERQALPMAHREQQTDLAWQELQTVLDEELHRLPEKYRAPFVLCCLEGKSKPEAARQLGWKEGTLSGRLALARQQVRQRLDRRGLALAAVLVGAALPETASAALPEHLARATLQAVVQPAAAGTLAAGGALAQGVLHDMVLGKVKLLTAVAVLALLGTGLAALTLVPSAPADEPRSEPPAAQARPAPPPPRLDRYGDPLPADALVRLGTVRFRHGYLIETVAVAADGKSAVTHGSDNTIRFWDLETGKELRRFRQDRRVWSMALSRNGNTLATAGRLVRLWDVPTGKVVRHLPTGEASVLTQAFSPDGKTLATGGNEQPIRLWDVASGKELRQCLASEGTSGSLAFSPDGQKLAASKQDGPAARLWEVATGKELTSLGGKVETSCKIAFSPDGKVLAAGDKGNTARLWDVATGKEIASFPHERGVRCVAFSPEGRLLASGSMDRTIRFWDVKTGREVRRIKDLPWNANSVTFTPDGSTLVSGGVWDSALHRWDVATGKEIRHDEGHQGPVDALGFLPDGKTLFSASRDRTIRLWDLTTGRETRRLGDEPLLFGGAVLSPEGRTLAVGGLKDARLALWNVTTGKKVRTFEGPAAGILHMAFSPDGKLLGSGGQDGRVRLWDPATGKQTRLLGEHGGAVDAVAFAPDGKLLISAGVDQTVCLWETATGKELRRVSIANEQALSLAFAPDGKTVAAGTLSTGVVLAEVATAKLLRQFATGQDLTYRVIFSPDGRLLAAGGEAQNVYLWEVASGKEIRQFAGDAGGTGSLAFSADGTRLAAGNSNSTILVWDVTGRARDRQKPGKPLGPRELEALWSTLTEREPAKAYPALWKLVSAGPEAVRLVREKLCPELRREADERAMQLVGELDAKEFAARQKATAELEKLGAQAEPALRRALQRQPGLELRQRLDRLLELVEGAEGSPRRLRLVRAVAVLEHVGSAESLELLKRLAEGAPEAALTREAKPSAERLSRRMIRPRSDSGWRPGW